MTTLHPSLHPLTDRQREFAEEYHDLVISYLRMRRLNMNDYYDIVIFGYLKAVQTYDEQPELQRFKFSTIACVRMRAVLFNYFRDLRCGKRNAVTYGFDTLQEDVYDDSMGFPPQYEYAEAREEWENIRSMITPEQMQVLKLRARGYTCEEVGKIYHISPGAVSSRICEIRKKMRRNAA